MKITKIELFHLPPRWVFLKVSTDGSIDGWGEPVLESRPHTTMAAVKELEHLLIGSDPLMSERIFLNLNQSSFYRGGPILMSAISGIDQALWDIKGKHFGVPVHQLLGGRVRNKIKVYSWIGGDDPSEAGNDALKRYEQGYRAVKMNATGKCEWIGSYKEIDAAAERIQDIRDKLGSSMDIALDFHGRVHKGMAKFLAKELERFRPLFYEEPVLPGNNEALEKIAQATSIPLATGERLYSRWDYKSIITNGFIDIIQPDLSHAGGITEVRKIASMAEAFDISIAPHCPLGPIATASCLQLDATIPNFAIQELSMQMHYNQDADLLDYIKNKDIFKIEDGYVKVPELPGLGLELDEDKVRDAAREFSGSEKRAQLWEYEDGSLAEW